MLEKVLGSKVHPLELPEKVNGIRTNNTCTQENNEAFGKVNKVLIGKNKLIRTIGIGFRNIRAMGCLVQYS